MTLIVSGLLGGCVQQVGDRLVSIREDGGFSEWDARANKQVIAICEDALIMIGYTGVAYLSGRPTDEIIAEAVAGLRADSAMRVSTGHSVGSVFQVMEPLVERLNREWRFPPGDPQRLNL